MLGYSVQKHKDIKPEEKPKAERAIKSLTLNDGCLRTLEDEAMRRREDPLEDTQETIKPQHIHVHINHYRFLVSFDVLQQAIKTMFFHKFDPKKFAFGINDWAQFFGDVGIVHPIPKI